MNKKIVFYLRVCLYLFAGYVIYDMFFANKKVQPVQLETFSENNQKEYVHYFFKYNDSTEVWNVLQTYPVAPVKHTFSDTTIWLHSSSVFKYYNGLGLHFVGAQFSGVALNADSFFHIGKSIGKLKPTADPLLKRITHQSSATLIFEKK